VDEAASNPITKVTDRVSHLVEFLTTVDKRILATLDSLEEMRSSMAELLARLDKMEGFADRFDGLESSLANIERATVHLDETMSGMVESLPDFMSRRIKSEAGEEPPP
jgi:uncharacterized coiled-coil protein SlyX